MNESDIVLNATALKEGETKEDLWNRLATTAVKYNKVLDYEDILHILRSRWLGPATPVAANFGRDTRFPVSCFGLQAPNSIHGIYQTKLTQALLSKNGGGVSVNVSHLVGPSNVVQWSKEYDLAAQNVSQTGVRRGAVAIYLDADHPDILDFLNAKDHHLGDHRNKIDSNIAINISDDFMSKLVEEGDPHAKRVFGRILELRTSPAGTPYLVFSDNIRCDDPPEYTNFGLKTSFSNLCSEIALGTSESVGFTCVLSSLNLALLDEWENWSSPRTGLDVPQIATMFLDAVCSEFIEKATNSSYYEDLMPLILGAELGRPLGLGVMGWHTLLQKRSIPFESRKARALNVRLFSWISESAQLASVVMGEELGVPELCRSTGMRNTHTTAVAPTMTNSVMVGGVSLGIEPISSNYYSHNGMHGIFTRKNSVLQDLIEKKGLPEADVWRGIGKNDGSVQGLDQWFTKHEQAVFKTAYEIDQNAIIDQASERQSFIDQAQSVNLFILPTANMAEVSKLHIDAWLKGLKSLYYVRSKNEKATSLRPTTPAAVTTHDPADYGAVPTLEELVLPESTDEGVCIPCQG